MLFSQLSRSGMLLTRGLPSVLTKQSSSFHSHFLEVTSTGGEKLQMRTPTGKRISVQGRQERAGGGGGSLYPAFEAVESKTDHTRKDAAAIVACSFP